MCLRVLPCATRRTIPTRALQHTSHVEPRRPCATRRTIPTRALQHPCRPDRRPEGLPTIRATPAEAGFVGFTVGFRRT